MNPPAGGVGAGGGSAWALAAAWAIVVAVGIPLHRPRPRRLPPCRPPAAAGPPPMRSGRPPHEAVGWWLIRVASRGRRLARPGVTPDPAERARARRLGGAALAALVAVPLAPAPLTPAAPLAAGLVAWALPGLRTAQAERRRLAGLEADLPEVVDLLVLAAAAGLTVPLAVEAAARRGAGPLASELRRVLAEAGRGRRLADALEHLPARAGDAVRPLVAALVDSDRYGAPLAPALERLAAEVRRHRQRRAEEAARRIPVKLLFPLVLCILPAFALLTLAPVVAGAVRTLAPGQPAKP